jgi:hypothetical protein
LSALPTASEALADKAAVSVRTRARMPPRAMRRTLGSGNEEGWFIVDYSFLNGK